MRRIANVAMHADRDVPLRLSGAAARIPGTAVLTARGADVEESEEENMHGFSRKILTVAMLAAGVWSTSALAKECYAPDARSQERAFSRAVMTEGGKVVWLGGQTGSATGSPRSARRSSRSASRRAR